MAKQRWTKPKAIAAAALLIGTYSVKISIDRSYYPATPTTEYDAIGEEEQTTDDYHANTIGRRGLSGDTEAGPIFVEEEESNALHRQEESAGVIHPWTNKLHPITTPPNPPNEPILFWHIPKSGGTTVKAIYYCFRKSILMLSTPDKIMEQRERSSSDYLSYRDLIITMRPVMVIENSFSPEKKGRALAVFRQPVERLVSKFYYLQVAKWERNYRPEWKDIDILDWAQNINTDNNGLVKQLAGKSQRHTATRADLLAAKLTLQQHFIVGITSQMGESIRRFNVVMGIDETDDGVADCMNSFFPKNQSAEEKGRRQLSPEMGNNNKQPVFYTPSGSVIEGTRGVSNANKHPVVEEGSDAWQLLARKNALDIELWVYILELFEEQRAIVNMYNAEK